MLEIEEARAIIAELALTSPDEKMPNAWLLATRSNTGWCRTGQRRVLATRKGPVARQTVSSDGKPSDAADSETVRARSDRERLVSFSRHLPDKILGDALSGRRPASHRLRRPVAVACGRGRSFTRTGVGAGIQVA